MPERTSGLFTREPREGVLRGLVARARIRLEGLPDASLVALLEDAVFHERKRLERDKAAEGEHERLDRAARAVVASNRDALRTSALELVAAWGDEIHGHFDPRVYGVATRLIPRVFTALLSPRPDRLRDWDLDLRRRLSVQGDLPLVQALEREAVLVLVPTHVSNMDSPLIGLALHLAELPPFVYGAGLNLFTNPVMSYFLSRLGAYTVDRKKRAALYKDTLKDYSVRCLVHRYHSLFFPGGTRARSGEVERRVKKGLLGTGITAWQENLAAGRPDPDVYFVPLTLSFQLCLEANTLIDDHLAESGKQRYIITDDEFSEPRTVASFARRVLELDDAVIARFGTPLDVLGNPVPAAPADREAASEERRGYVTDAEGRVEWDDQRDRVYTDRLADAIVDAYQHGTVVLSTHLAAWTAWECLRDAAGSHDEIRIVRLPVEKRRIDGASYRQRLGRALASVDDGVRAGRFHAQLPSDAASVLADAIHHFGRYHRSRAVRIDGDDVVVDDPRLCLYYRNRLTHLALEA